MGYDVGIAIWLCWRLNSYTCSHTILEVNRGFADSSPLILMRTPRPDGWVEDRQWMRLPEGVDQRSEGHIQIGKTYLSVEHNSFWSKWSNQHYESGLFDTWKLTIKR